LRGLLLFLICGLAQGHDVITTALTFDRDISRILYTSCVSCHHPDGKAFSLMTYSDVRPWAVAMKEEILQRRMPPWGAVKGFGDFRNDQALTPEQMERIVSWVDGGVPEGEPKDLPPAPKFEDDPALTQITGALKVSGEHKLDKPFSVEGLLPQSIPDNASLMITAQLPNGQIEPLVWLKNYKAQFDHPFLFRKPLDVPAGTVIRGVPANAAVLLLPVGSFPPPVQKTEESPHHTEGSK